MAARCAGDPSTAPVGSNAVTTAGPGLGDDSLEVTAHLSAPSENYYMGADFVVIWCGQDLIVIQQSMRTGLGANLDPATDRQLAAAAYTAYQG